MKNVNGVIVVAITDKKHYWLADRICVRSKRVGSTIHLTNKDEREEFLIAVAHQNGEI
jgi:hypothetical protein